MNIRQIEIFVNIVTYGNFSNAAKKMFLSQPTVSNNIDQLEEELGARLFIRNGRKAILTETGERFYRHAISMVNIKEQIFAEIADSKSDRGGNIRIIASFVPGTYILPKLIKKYCAIHDNVRFEVVVKNSKEAFDAIQDGFYDIGFVGSKVMSDKVKYHTLQKDKMVVIAPDMPPYSDWKETVDFRDIKDKPFIMRSSGSATRDLFDYAVSMNQWDLKHLNILVETDSGELVKQCVKNGLGISVVSELSAEPGDGILKFHVNHMDIHREYYIIHQTSEYMSPRIKAFLSFVDKELNQ